MTAAARMVPPPLFADENTPAPSIALLRDAGFNVLSMAERNAGAPDSEVMRLARVTHRVLVTLDREFADRLVRGTKSHHVG